MDDFKLNASAFIESTKSLNFEEYTTEESENDDDDDAYEDNGYDDDEYNSENEDFYFESDHLALRGNLDYRAVLRTIVVLESQRIEATKHIDTIAEVKRKATQDPCGFIKKLTSGQSLNIPGPINIQNVKKNSRNLTPITNPF